MQADKAFFFLNLQNYYKNEVIRFEKKQLYMYSLYVYHDLSVKYLFS
jgi:hypothetical protein